MIVLRDLGCSVELSYEGAFHMFGCDGVHASPGKRGTVCGDGR